MTDKEITEMLGAVGIPDIGSLFRDIPADVRAGLDLPPPMAEIDLMRHISGLASLNVPAGQTLSFLGGGIYRHHIPPAVLDIVSRAEFLTAYTPYQPEMSQGMLVAIFEFQSLLARLLGMEVVNASMYDGATALGEAVRMAARVSKHDAVVVPRAMAPWKLSVLRSYADTAGIRVVQAGYDGTGALDLDRLPSEASGILYVESPNYLGVVEQRIPELREMADLLIVGVNPISMGVLKPPGEHGADIAVAEGQPLGIPPGFGGPLLGVMAARKEHVRQMPGRLIAMTTDAKGDRAFTMTLQTREQHIRRQKATSNICTNHGLCAVMAATYLSIVGPRLKDVAEKCMENRMALERGLASAGLEPRFNGLHFNEFAVRLPVDFGGFRDEMLLRGILPGIDLAGFGLPGHMLVATTEVHTTEDIERYVSAVREVVA
ncbi:MAG: aminomethyl-transferring glycine dehydrogenase subunit GcvPA [Thermoplasmata archaeon]|nr:aminomethyl-transferring glycine dehydrogenase subunit GcvPA [Thermoplasmata archaeon]